MKIGVFILSLFWMTFLSCQQDQEREGVESIIFRTASTLLAQDASTLNYLLTFQGYLNTLEPPLKTSTMGHYMESWIQLRSLPLTHAALLKLEETGSKIGGLFGLHPKASSYPKHLGWITEKPYKVEPKDYVTSLSLEMGQGLYGLTLGDRVAIRKRMSQRSREIFHNLYHEKGNRIPHITHRIWITSKESPKEPSPKHLRYYLNSLRKLTSSSWHHNFWCVDPNGLPLTIKALKESGLPIQIRKIEEIYPIMQAKHIFDAYYQDHHYCLSSEIARTNILYQEGGVYADMGTEFLQDLTPFVDAYDHIWVHKFSGFTDGCFFGLQPKNLSLGEYLKVLDQLYTLPSHLKSISPKKHMQNIWLGGALIMSCLDKFSQPQDRFLFVPEEGRDSLITIDHGASWVKKNDPFGNRPITEARVDILTIRPK